MEVLDCRPASRVYNTTEIKSACIIAFVFSQFEVQARPRYTFINNPPLPLGSSRNFGFAATTIGASTMSDADAGLITILSAHSVKETIDRIEAEVKSKGMTIFARVDHAAGAREVGLTLRPTLLLIFGNAKGGTPLMQDKQQIGIDLPLKALAWEDASGKTWLSYNDLGWLARRHGLGHEADPVVVALSAVLGTVLRKAAS
jgi:uncharacterized protein (DUF302 family)